MMAEDDQQALEDRDAQQVERERQDEDAEDGDRPLPQLVDPVTLELAVQRRDVLLMVGAALDVAAADPQDRVVLGDEMSLRLGFPVDRACPR